MSGVLRYEIEVLEPAQAPDGAGGAQKSFSVAATIWAGVEMLASVTSVSGDRPARLRRIRALVRSRPDIALGARIRFQGADYEVTSIESDDERGRRVFVIAEEALS